MDVAVLLVRIVLAVVLIVAGIAKWLDRESTREELPAFGMPEVLASPIAVSLPVVELGIGVLLFPVTTARLASVAAALLFASFSVVVGRALVAGRSPDCHCFGALSSGGIGAFTIVRSTALALASAFVALAWVEPPLGLIDWLTGLSTTAVVLIGLALTVAAAITIGVAARRQRPGTSAIAGAARPERSERAAPDPSNGLPVGTPAPAFHFLHLDGTEGSSSEWLPAERPLLLVFMSPTCFACRYLRPRIARWTADPATTFDILVVSSGDLDANRKMRDESGIDHLVVQRDGEVGGLFEVTGTPEAVLIAADGTIASPLAVNALEIKWIAASLAPAGSTV